MRWGHFEADSECDEFWSTDVKIYKNWSVEVHVGKSRETGKFDFQILDQGKEIVCRTGYRFRKEAEAAMWSELSAILDFALHLLKKRRIK